MALAQKAEHPEWVEVKDGPPAPGFDAGRVDDAGTGAGGFLRRAAGSRTARELEHGVRQGVLQDDVEPCLDLDQFPFAMIATSEDSLMVLRPSCDPAGHS